MKKFLIIWCLILLANATYSKSLDSLLCSMPDSIVPQLNKNLRIELIELKEMGVRSEVTNLLNSSTQLDTLTNNYLHLSIDSLMSLQIKKLPYEDKDTILCIIKSYTFPSGESEISFHHQDWSTIPATSIMEGNNIQEWAGELMTRPDTMPENQFLELSQLIEPQMIQAELSPDDNTITFHLSTPFVGKDKKEQIDTILLQRKLKWQESSFKRY